MMSIFTRATRSMRALLLYFRSRLIPIVYRLVYPVCPRIYWENRHGTRDLGAVGHSGRSDEYNLALYAQKNPNIEHCAR